MIAVFPVALVKDKQQTNNCTHTSVVQTSQLIPAKAVGRNDEAQSPKKPTLINSTETQCEVVVAHAVLKLTFIKRHAFSLSESLSNVYPFVIDKDVHSTLETISGWPADGWK